MPAFAKAGVCVFAHFLYKLLEWSAPSSLIIETAAT